MIPIKAPDKVPVAGVAGEVCIFCLTHRSRNNTCSYGLHHEYPCDYVREVPVQIKKISKDICSLCNLHKKNPLTATSECKHNYPA